MTSRKKYEIIINAERCICPQLRHFFITKNIKNILLRNDPIFSGLHDNTFISVFSLTTFVKEFSKTPVGTTGVFRELKIPPE